MIISSLSFMHFVTQVKSPLGFEPGSPVWESEDLTTELSLPPYQPFLPVCLNGLSLVPSRSLNNGPSSLNNGPNSLNNGPYLCVWMVCQLYHPAVWTMDPVIWTMDPVVWTMDLTWVFEWFVACTIQQSEQWTQQSCSIFSVWIVTKLD